MAILLLKTKYVCKWHRSEVRLWLPPREAHQKSTKVYSRKITTLNPKTYLTVLTLPNIVKFKHQMTRCSTGQAGSSQINCKPMTSRNTKTPLQTGRISTRSKKAV